MAVKTVLTLPSTGRTPTWTGRTLSGSANYSIVPMTNRTVQLHFESSIHQPFAHTFENEVFEQLATFLYEYPLRHLGIQPDELDQPRTQTLHDPAFYAASGIPIFNPRVQIPVFPISTNNATNVYELRLSHKQTVGREFIKGCPTIGEKLFLSNLQAAAFVYKYYPAQNILILKIEVTYTDAEFERAHRDNFSDFKFHEPLLFRDAYCMNKEIHFSRGGSSTKC